MPEHPVGQELPLTILFRDSHVVAIDKPPGLLVHRTNLDRHETRFAVQMLRDQIGQRVWPAHRLDRGTSGVLLFGLSAEAGQALSRLFEERRVDKRYLAVVRGHPPEAGEIDHPLTRIADDQEMPDRLAIARAPGKSQDALSRYRRLVTCEYPWAIDRWPTSRYALVELEPVTGRRHQLRRHLKHIAHPIIGDATYGKGIHNRRFAEELNCRRLLLACTSLQFPSLESGKIQLIQAPLRGDFATLLNRPEWRTSD